jgi:hypothetical protein
MQSADNLKKLRIEVEHGRELHAAAHERELQKKEFLITDRLIFEQSSAFTETKEKLSIQGKGRIC